MTADTLPDAPAERPIDAVRGTSDRLPAEAARLAALEALLLDRFARAGYEPLATPVLEPTELHERKSGAGIVSKLFELAGAGAGAGQGGVCLRPELTAGIVRAFTAAEPEPTLPWRVSHAGAVFRYEPPRPDRLREFRQVGVERIGDGGPLADAEVVWLADWTLAEAGVTQTSIRLGHVGLILEMLRRSGLPAPLGAALIERLSEAAAEGHGVHALETGLEQLRGWLGGHGSEGDRSPDVLDTFEPNAEIDRLFRTLVPVVTGRRTGGEIVNRLRRKWDLSHGLLAALDRVRAKLHDLGDLTGNPFDVLDRLGPDGQTLAPDSVAGLRGLLGALDGFGVDPGRITLDLGFGRGIGFYSQLVFEITARTPDGRTVEVGGGGRYDGLARVLGSPRDDRGVGFAFGLERLASVLDAQGRPSPGNPRPALVVVADDPSHAPHAARLAAELRSLGVRVLLDSGRSVASALDSAARSGADRVISVSGPVDGRDTLTLHDPGGNPPVFLAPGDLARIARDANEARRP